MEGEQLQRTARRTCGCRAGCPARCRQHCHHCLEGYQQHLIAHLECVLRSQHQASQRRMSQPQISRRSRGETMRHCHAGCQLDRLMPEVAAASFSRRLQTRRRSSQRHRKPQQRQSGSSRRREHWHHRERNDHNHASAHEQQHHRDPRLCRKMANRHLVGSGPEEHRDRLQVLAAARTGRRHLRYRRRQ